MVRIQEIRPMVDKFVEVVKCEYPKESQVLILARKMGPLSIDSAKKAFRVMAESVEYRIFPLPSEWATVIGQVSVIDETAQRKEIALCKDDEKPTDEDWEAFNRELKKLHLHIAVPEPEKRYLSPEEAMIGWQERQDELHRSIRFLDANGLIGKTGVKKKEKRK